MESTRKKRARPIAAVTPDYRSLEDEYPQRLRVPFSNGTVQRYVKEEPQPHPSFLIAMSILKSWPEGSYRPPKIKKRWSL